jgi:hypothetical protein
LKNRYGIKFDCGSLQTIGLTERPSLYISKNAEEIGIEPI